MQIQKDPTKKSDKTGKVIQKETEDKSYKRYKHICYRKLVLKGLLFFILGLLVHFLLFGY